MGTVPTPSKVAETAPCAFQVRVDLVPIEMLFGEAVNVIVGGAAAVASCRVAPGTRPRQPSEKMKKETARDNRTDCTNRMARNINSPQKGSLSGTFDSGT